jgi:hypothetical protein
MLLRVDDIISGVSKKEKGHSPSPPAASNDEASQLYWDFLFTNFMIIVGPKPVVFYLSYLTLLWFFNF